MNKSIKWTVLNLLSLECMHDMETFAVIYIGDNKPGKVYLHRNLSIMTCTNKCPWILVHTHSACVLTVRHQPLNIVCVWGGGGSDPNLGPHLLKSERTKYDVMWYKSPQNYSVLNNVCI